MRPEPLPVVRAPAFGAGYASKADITNPRITFNIKLVGPDLGFRTFRPGRNPKEHTTP